MLEQDQDGLSKPRPTSVQNTDMDARVFPHCHSIYTKVNKHKKLTVQSGSLQKILSVNSNDSQTWLHTEVSQRVFKILQVSGYMLHTVNQNF